MWTEGDTDTYGRLYGPDGLRLTSDDDNGPGNNFGLYTFVTPESFDSYYYLKVSGRAGRYRLRVEQGEGDHGRFEVTATELSLPAEETGMLEASPIYNWWDLDMFKLSVDRPLLSFRAWTSGGVDTRCSLFDSDGIEIVGNDDHGPGDNCGISRGILEPGTYYIWVVPERYRVNGAYRLHVEHGDDHAAEFNNATRIALPSGTEGHLAWFAIDGYTDQDVFWFQVATPGNVEIRTTGAADLYGWLYDADRVELASQSFGSGRRISQRLEAGTYYVALQRAGCRACAYGPYTLHISGDASGVVTVPLVPQANNAHGQQGFVRAINHSDEDASVAITAVDSTGMAIGEFDLALGPWQTVHFNSNDLERGNDAKGIDGVGTGEGDWYLEVVPSRPGVVELLSYIRTRDGFLTSIHGQTPTNGRRHRVPIFNPGSNTSQASRLRLIYPRRPALDAPNANVEIFGVDDAGVRSPTVRLELSPGASREVTAQQLEDGESWLDGRLGDGAGKWQLVVNADQSIQVMSLLQTPTGHITNLSVPPMDAEYDVPEAP